MTQQEIPENYLGEHAMKYTDPDLVRIIASFFPIQDITAQKGGLMGNEVGFKNTEGCSPEDDVYLLQNKEEYLDQFGEDSTKQAQVDYTALIQFINSLAKALEKNENKLIYFRTGDYAPFAPESSAKAHALFSDQLSSFNFQVLDKLISSLEEKITNLENQVNVREENGSGSNLEMRRGEKGTAGARGPRGFTGAQGPSGTMTTPHIKDVAKKILMSEEFKEAIDKVKEDRLSGIILEGLNSTVGGMMEAMGGQLTLEVVIIISVTFSISTSILLTINSLCIFAIYRRNRAIDAKRALRKKGGQKLAKLRPKKR